MYTKNVGFTNVFHRRQGQDNDSGTMYVLACAPPPIYLQKHAQVLHWLDPAASRAVLARFRCVPLPHRYAHGQRNRLPTRHLYIGTVALYSWVKDMFVVSGVLTRNDVLDGISDN